MSRDATEVDANLKGIDASGEEHQLLCEPDGTLHAKLSGTVPLPTNAAKETGGNLAATKTAAETLAGKVGADGLAVEQADATKLKNTEANSAGILAALGATGANFIKTAVDAVAAILGPAGSVGILLTHIDSLLDTGGATLNAIQQITAEIQAMRGQAPVPFTWAGLGAAEFVIGPALTAGAKYEVTCVQWDADDDGAGTTNVQLSIGYATSFAPGASQYEVYASATLAFVAGVIGIANPYNTGRPFLADGSGQLYGVATPTGGATTNGSGTIWVRRIY